MMNQQMIWMFGGRMGAGKTTISGRMAAFMVMAGYDIIHAPFAAPLKREVAEMCNFSPVLTLTSEGKKTVIDVPEDIEAPEKRMTVRELLQWWGQKMRNHDKDYWVYRNVEYIKNKLQEHRKAIVMIDDVRYPNEIAGISTAFLDNVNSIQSFHVAYPVLAKEDYIPEMEIAYKAHMDRVVPTGDIAQHPSERGFTEDSNIWDYKVTNIFNRVDEVVANTLKWVVSRETYTYV
jgi:hypothetical protein